jgi:hypothetical protein
MANDLDEDLFRRVVDIVNDPIIFAIERASPRGR